MGSAGVVGSSARPNFQGALVADLQTLVKDKGHQRSTNRQKITKLAQVESNTAVHQSHTPRLRIVNRVGASVIRVRPCAWEVLYRPCAAPHPDPQGDTRRPGYLRIDVN